MATSGTTAFSLSVNDCIVEALDRIGGSPEGAVNWHGMLGPFRLYNICLTPEQVAQNFHAQRHRFGISGSLG